MSVAKKTIPAQQEEKPLNVHQAFVRVARGVRAISRDRRNVVQKFNYRGYEDIYNHLHPLMAQYGLFTLPRVLSSERSERTTNNGGTLLYTILTIEYTIHAEDGSSITLVSVGEGMDSGDKATSKAMTAAHKSALVQAFMIPTEDMPDADGEGHAVAPEEKPATEEQMAMIQDYRDAQQIPPDIEKRIADRSPLTVGTAAAIIKYLKEINNKGRK